MVSNTLSLSLSDVFKNNLNVLISPFNPLFWKSKLYQFLQAFANSLYKRSSLEQKLVEFKRFKTKQITNFPIF